MIIIEHPIKKWNILLKKMEHPTKNEWMIWGYPHDLGNLRLTGNRYRDSNLIYLHRRQERPIFCLLDGKTLHIPFIGFLQTMYTPQGARITWTLDFGSLNIGHGYTRHF